jgi:polyhydroxyalkanoate synthesis regulator phasin
MSIQTELDVQQLREQLQALSERVAALEDERKAEPKREPLHLGRKA